MDAEKQKRLFKMSLGSRKIDPSILPQLKLSYKDDPQAIADAAVDDFNGHVVPQTQRSSRGSLTMAWWGMASAMVYLVTCAAIAGVVGTVDAIIGIVLSIIVYSLFNAFLARLSATTGLNMAMISRSIFGKTGSAVAALVISVTLLWYFVFEASIIGVAFEYQFGGSLELWLIGVSILSVALVWRGAQVLLDKINGFLFPVYLIGLLSAVIWATLEYGNGWSWLSAEGTSSLPVPGWLIAFCSLMGIYALIMASLDFARLSRIEDIKFHQIVTFGPVFYTLIYLVAGVAGIYLAAIVPLEGQGFGETAAAISIIELMGVLGVAFVTITQLRINTVNLYASSLNLGSFFNIAFGLNVSRLVWLIVLVVAGYFIMISGFILEYVLLALAYQAVFVTAWVAIVVVHGIYVMKGHRKMEFRPWRVPNMNPAGLLAWGVSVVIGLSLSLIPGVDDSVATVAPIITVVLAAGIYVIALRLAKKSWFYTERQEGLDPALEVDDPWGTRIECFSCNKSYVALEMDRIDPEFGGQPYCSVCADEHLRKTGNSSAPVKSAEM